jgi:hypothetical protein
MAVGPAMLVAVATLAAITEASAQRPASALPRTPLACSAPTVGETPLVVDGRAVYVEPQAFVPSGDRLLLAGTPVYVLGVAGEPAFVRRDSVMGVVIDSSGLATLLVPPVAGRLVHDVRAAAAGPGEWAVTFAEAEPTPTPRDEPRVMAYWFGLTDGASWSRLTRIPFPDRPPRSMAASALVRTPQGFVLAVPLHRTGQAEGRPRDAVVLEWDLAQVRSEPVEALRPGYVALAADAAGDLVLGVVRPDFTEARDENSLFVYRRQELARVWRPLRRLVRGLGQPVHDPLIDVTDAGLVFTWRAALTSGDEGRAIVARSLDGVVPAPMTLGAGAAQVLSVPARTAPLWVLVAPPDSAGSRVRVMTRTDAGLETTIETDSRFTAPIAVAWWDRRLLLTGAVTSRAVGSPPLQSRVLSVDCVQ